MCFLPPATLTGGLSGTHCCPLQAVDCTLPEGHPYRQACGLREGSSTSLVSTWCGSWTKGATWDQRVALSLDTGSVKGICAASVCWLSRLMQTAALGPLCVLRPDLAPHSRLLRFQVSLEFCSFPPSHSHPAVPPGLQYYTLQAQLSGEAGALELGLEWWARCLLSAPAKLVQRPCAPVPYEHPVHATRTQRALAVPIFWLLLKASCSLLAEPSCFSFSFLPFVLHPRRAPAGVPLPLPAREPHLHLNHAGHAAAPTGSGCGAGAATRRPLCWAYSSRAGRGAGAGQRQQPRWWRLDDRGSATGGPNRAGG